MRHGFYWVLPSFTGFLRVLASVMGSPRMLPSFTGFFLCSCGVERGFCTAKRETFLY